MDSQDEPFKKQDVKKGPAERFGRPAVERPGATKVKLPTFEPMDLDNDDEVKVGGRGGKKEAPATKLQSKLEERVTNDDVLQSILKAPISLKLEECLTGSPQIIKGLVDFCQKRKVAISNDTKVTYEKSTNTLNFAPVSDVNHVSPYHGSPHNQAPVYSVPLAYVKVIIEGKPIVALVDRGSMINIWKEMVRESVKANCRTDQSHVLRGVNGQSEYMFGVSEHISIGVGGISVPSHIFAVETCSQDLILGVPFLQSVNASIKWDSSGKARMNMTFKGKRVEVLVTSASPGTTKIRTWEEADEESEHREGDEDEWDTRSFVAELQSHASVLDLCDEGNEVECREVELRSK
jgi:hypothetical protein